VLPLLIVCSIALCCHCLLSVRQHSVAIAYCLFYSTVLPLLIACSTALCCHCFLPVGRHCVAIAYCLFVVYLTNNYSTRTISMKTNSFILNIHMVLLYPLNVFADDTAFTYLSHLQITTSRCNDLTAVI